ncbi:hypothetical protein [Aureivirga marina]|uniref:hypothetical protein n=1 Tax=Aureivirga marina TaxID=1182451 RepID=UPI0018CB1A6A|nr:hypothetical protein [Aureivirga marina]
MNKNIFYLLLFIGFTGFSQEKLSFAAKQKGIWEIAKNTTIEVAKAMPEEK